LSEGASGGRGTDCARPAGRAGRSSSARARTHDGLRAAIAQHFVKPGDLDAKYSRLLARTAADRNDADYAAVTTFRAEDAEQGVKQAEEFVSAVATYLSL
jgi:uncharacterized protein (UPF0332 family)